MVRFMDNDGWSYKNVSVNSYIFVDMTRCGAGQSREEKTLL